MTRSGTCFVIQPFDAGQFDKRYREVFAPAIEAAGLDPYRVDLDPSASIPISHIEEGIRRADVCFAEISTDNPNVWFELGYAIASGKEVVLACSDQRDKHFPFDVQHRAIIKYQTESPSDYAALGERITQRLVAAINKQIALGSVAELSPVRDTQGLSSHEVVALVAIAKATDAEGDVIAAHLVRQDMRNAGFTDIAGTLALRGLTRKGMIAHRNESEFNESYVVYSVTHEGIAWLEENQEKLVLREAPRRRTSQRSSSPFDADEDLPF